MSAGDEGKNVPRVQMIIDDVNQSRTLLRSRDDWISKNVINV